MLPLSLTLKNFMSYGDEPTTLDFRGMDVICLSGDNGHGKSAILDAITYALWGETRLGKQGHEQLIRLGADEMAVVFDFLLGSTTYRVRRQRSRKSGGQVWEIQAIEDDGSLRPLTGLNTSDTGRVITRLLRMNYDTFLNSAYLKQGRADEFVRQPPMRRKDILGEILDLSRYDELEYLARQKAREWADKKVDAERALAQIDAVISEQPELQTAFDENIAIIARLETESKTLVLSIEANSLKLALIESKRRESDEGIRRLAAIDSQIAEIQKAIAADQSHVTELSTLIIQRPAIESDYQKLQEANALIEALTADTDKLVQLQQSLAQLEQSIENQRRELQYHLTTLSSELAKAEVELAHQPSLQADLKTLSALIQEISESKRQIDTFSNKRDSLVNKLAELKAQYNSIQEKLNKLDDRELRLSAQSETCSICGSPLSNIQIIKITGECEIERQELEKSLTDCKRQGVTAKNELTNLDSEIKSTQSTIDQAEAKSASLAASEHRLKALDETQAQLPELKKQMLESEKHINSDSFAKAERAEVDKLKAQVALLAASPTKLKETREQVKSLQSVIQLHAQLTNARRDHKAAQDRLSSSSSQVEALTVEKNRISSGQQDTSNLDTESAALTETLQKSRWDQVSTSSESRRAQAEQGRLQSRLDQIAKSFALKTAREAELKSAKHEAQLYTELAGAFGKRGVQALIIDSAMPELESDASDLLEKLSDGSMSLSVQTQRASKTKSSLDEPIETLDIIVRDDLGERALEMYSGGEAFRVSFALRIALSKLLARRAGADLQALIIDEGFGSQDSSGREKLVDAIMAIREDFAQIIVITHVDELKDAFSNRIEIVKTPTGSQTTLVVGSALG